MRPADGSKYTFENERIIKGVTITHYKTKQREYFDFYRDDMKIENNSL